MPVKFFVSPDKCIQCAKCIDICSPKCLQLVNNIVTIDKNKCIKCGHCFAVCPTAAISIFDIDPDTEKFAEDPVSKAIQMRHSIRSFKPEMFTNQELSEMLQILKFAPSARNARKTRYMVLTRPKLEQIIPIAGEVLMDKYPNMKAMLQRSADPIFRGAPHLIVAVEAGQVSVDGVIALSEFEILVASKGFGTCQCDFFISASNNQQIREAIGLQDNETVIACLTFGKFEAQFVRPVARQPLNIDIQ
ncbi:Nitroreductase_Fd-NR2 [Hexamita inflata]|uniref:Nitroreductase Fd-NR2 n=1 Tax=Hexamita inflata TaxID=28002 RepID=A0AA86UPK1_9EUKA|nr:Nitroreductase Fd-NR2 [Hexamita inflata]